MEGEAVTTMADAITQGITTVGTLFTEATNMISESPVAMAFIVMSLIGGAIGLFSQVRHA